MGAQKRKEYKVYVEFDRYPGKGTTFSVAGVDESEARDMANIQIDLNAGQVIGAKIVKIVEL